MTSVRRGWRLSGRYGSAAALAAVLLAGCQPDQPAEPDVEMLDGVVMTEFALPLDAYRSTDVESTRVVSQAWNAVFVGCMREFGFGQEPYAPPPRELGGNARLYGLVDLARAQSSGYFAPAAEPDPSQVDPEVPELPDEWYAVAEGSVARTTGGQAVPEGGCDGEARRALGAGTPAGADLPLADRLAGEASDLTEQDSRVQEAFAAWRACMAEKGFDYPDPWAANDDDSWTAAPPDQRPTDREVLTATADVECKIAVDLVDIWASVNIAYEQQALEQHAAELALVKQYREIELTNAVAVLDGA